MKEVFLFLLLSPCVFTTCVLWQVPGINPRDEAQDGVKWWKSSNLDRGSGSEAVLGGGEGRGGSGRGFGTDADPLTLFVKLINQFFSSPKFLFFFFFLFLCFCFKDLSFENQFLKWGEGYFLWNINRKHMSFELSQHPPTRCIVGGVTVESGERGETCSTFKLHCFRVTLVRNI